MDSVSCIDTMHIQTHTHTHVHAHTQTHSNINHGKDLRVGWGMVGFREYIWEVLGEEK